MQYKTSKQIRKMWLDFWESKTHRILPSKSLVPQNDNSILWINSGVATLKDYFSGEKQPVNKRLANSQKCLRTNDIDNVGVTARHHTLFEMLGNFSIGDYFKQEAITWAYEFIFDVLQFKKDKIYITYYEQDLDTFNFWKKLGISDKHLIPGSKDMNFWDLGSGPCGPDTEIFYDRGEKYDPQNIGLKLLKDDIENDRYIEIWNIVFSQFNNNGENNYTELKQKNIDTGAGFERICSIFQNAPTNFDTDLFLPLIKKIEAFTNSTYQIDNYFIKEKSQKQVNKHFKVIADHVRAITHAIQDGAVPSNTQRGYIIRRLLRRAYRSGKQLGITEQTFLHQLVPTVASVLDYYSVNIEKVQAVIKKEEIAFAATINQGEKLLHKSIKDNRLEPKIAFKLFETFGFPIELTQEILEEKNITLDLEKYRDLLKEHAKISRGDKVTKAMKNQIQVLKEVENRVSEFIGYETLTCNDAQVLIQKQENNKLYLLLNKTPFYATSGGQQHDYGTINDAQVLDVFKDSYDNHWHIINKKVEGKIECTVDAETRMKKARNHSGTHILGYALRKVLGNHVVQLGSDNNEARLRFDFPYEHKLTPAEIIQIEAEVKSLIKQSIEREYILDTWENGLKMGALALENEEHEAETLSRIVKFNKSIEFCGGTHVESSSDLQDFKIIKVEAKGSGTYRIEALTSSDTIENYLQQEINHLKTTLSKLIDKNKVFDQSYQLKLPNTIHNLQKAVLQVREDYKHLSKKNNQVQIEDNSEFETYHGIKAVIKLDMQVQEVKPYAIALRDKHKDALIIIGSKYHKTMMLAVASLKHDAQKVFQEIIKSHEGKGGGNSNFAMGKIIKEFKK